MKTTVFCTFQVDGLHYWPDAPVGEVAFLGQKHRHMFHFRCELEVAGQDRQVEFIKAKRILIATIHAEFFDKDRCCCDFGSMSCEMIAQWVVNGFDLIEGIACQRCEVSEDGENGAIVERN